MDLGRVSIGITVGGLLAFALRPSGSHQQIQCRTITATNYTIKQIWQCSDKHMYTVYQTNTNYLRFQVITSDTILCHYSSPIVILLFLNTKIAHKPNNVLANQSETKKSYNHTEIYTITSLYAHSATSEFNTNFRTAKQTIKQYNMNFIHFTFSCEIKS